MGKAGYYSTAALPNSKSVHPGEKRLPLNIPEVVPKISEGMTLIEMKDGRLIITLDPEKLPVSDAIAHLAAGTELIDVSVSGITAEEMVAELYREYHI